MLRQRPKTNSSFVFKYKLIRQISMNPNDTVGPPRRYASPPWIDNPNDEIQNNNNLDLDY